MDQQRQLEHFASFRHDKGRLDRFRSVISSNADIINGVATQVAEAASAAFPPSSAILTAFTFVMTASKHVSEDYDMIESFFDMMHSFLKRLSLLENKIPPQQHFQVFLVNVFSALLKLSAMARTYCAKGRFHKWAKALVDGKDPDLQAAYGALTGNLQNLESAIIMQTLRTTIEISEVTRSTNQSVAKMQGQLGGIAVMSMQTLETSQQTFSATVRVETGVEQLLHTSVDNAATGNEVLRLQKKMLDKLQSKESKDKQRNMSSGASRPANFERLRIPLKNDAEGGINERLADMKQSCVEGLFDWIQDDPYFEAVLHEEESFLGVSATAGMGKSSLAFRMFALLEQRYASSDSTCVVWFPFDEERPEMRSVNNMLRCCAIRAAKKDEHYCTETLKALQRDDSNSVLDEDEDAWNHLIESRFTKKSDRRLILILDGVDQIRSEDLPTFLNLLGRVKGQDCAIQVIFTYDPDNELSLSSLDVKRIQLSRDNIAHDMRKFAWSRTKTLSRLRKLRRDFRKTIRKKVMQKADSFLYIDHTMRRLNALGREGPITKELEILSENTTALYHTLFEECQKNRTTEDQELLRNLLAWLAYMKTKLTVAEANFLIEVFKKENVMSIEEELDGRLSRLLRISGDRAENEQDESSGDDDRPENSSGEAEQSEKRAEDADNFLSFQERSLKAYFRDAIQDHRDGLRCTATEAHAIIFRTCATVLTMANKDQNRVARKLINYASEWWLSHLLEIKPDKNGSVGDDLAKLVIESIYSILTNKNNSLRCLETQSNKTILTSEDIGQDEVLATLAAWANRAVPLPANQLPYGILDWFRPLAQEPRRVFIGLSRSHITNWFSSGTKREAYAAFVCAHAALQEGRNLPELKQSPVLGQYFAKFIEEGESFNERSFEVVAGCFWDIVKTSSSYKGIGMAMDCEGFEESAIKQFDKGLDDGTIDKLEQFLLLTSKGEALQYLGWNKAEDERQKKSYLEESLAIFTEAIGLYRNMSEADQNDEKYLEAASYSLSYIAQAAADLGKSESVLAVFKEKFHSKAAVRWYTLSDVMSSLKNTGQSSTMIDILKLLDKNDITWHLTFSDSIEVTQEAAVRANEGQYLLGLYETAMKIVATWSFDEGELRTRLQSNAAVFALQALGDLDYARALLRGMINHPRTPSWRVLSGCNQLADILFEDLRRSKDPFVKKKALEEVSLLLNKPAEVLPNSYNAAESHLIITVALMLQRLGPALDYSERLHTAFRNSLDKLKDTISANDSYALRRLARILGCVPGFEEAASISYSAQFYIIDEDIHRKEKEIEKASQEREAGVASDQEVEVINTTEASDNAPVEHDAPVAVQSIDALINGDATEDNLVETKMNGIAHSVGASNDHGEESAINVTEPETVISEIDDGLDEEAGFYCNFCRNNVQDWSHGAAYLCVYCIDMDICEECYLKKIARDKGELEPDWRTMCPKGHRHVKAPIEGWRGVKSGMLRIGTNEVLFKTWLAELEVKWAKYWEDFWTESETT
jgi:hypothetical protein